MAESPSASRWARRATGALAAVVAVVLTGTMGAAPSPAKTATNATPASSGSLQGWLGDGTTWPERALALFAPAGKVVNASTVRVTEGGVKAGGVSVTPLRQAGPRDFGLMVVVGASPSMTGAPLNAAMSAVGSLAATRSAGQQLGVVTFSARPRVFVPLTSSTGAIGQILSGAPDTGRGADVPSAINLGLAQLTSAKVALGAIIVVSDGIGNLTGSGATTPAAVKTAAAAANVPVFTVGLQDRASSPESLHNLAGVSPGQFVASSPARLAATFGEVYSTVTRGYIARWRSGARTAQTVAVAATVAGASGNVQASYRAPATAASPAPESTSAAVTHRLTAADISLSGTDQLSRRPTFAVASSVVAPAVTTPAGTGKFWNNPRSIVLVAGICGLLLAFALAMVLYRPSKRGVRARVGSFIPVLEAAGDPLQGPAPSRGGLAGRIERSSWWPPFVENVEISGGVHTPIDLVKRSVAVALVLAVLVTVVSGSALVALVPLLLWPFALRKVIARSAKKQREKFRDTLPGYLQDLASAMRVGRSFVGGLSAVVETADEPVRGAFERAITDEAFGRPVEEALDAVAERMQASDLEQVALIAGLNRRSGSNVSEALDRVAEGARERADLRREIKALTGQARMSSWVLTALPGFLLVAMNVVSPLYAKPLLHTTLGIVLLFLGAAMVYGGFKVMQKITDVEP